MSSEAGDGWAEYSKLVLKELETLAEGVQGLRAEIQCLTSDISELRVKFDRVDELREWKSKIDEIASPTQLKLAMKQIEDLKQFKIRAITIFAVAQFGMAVAMWALKAFG